MKIAQQEVVMTPTATLQINETAINTYSTPSNYEDMKKSINEHGIIQPIQVNYSDKKIISGNLRVQIALELKIEFVEVIFYDFTDEEINTALILSNKQRIKTTTDLYRENELINELFTIKKGSRSDLFDDVKEQKEQKDQMKKDLLSTYLVNSFNKINKLGKIKYGENYKEHILEKMKQVDKKETSLNKIMNELKMSPKTMNKEKCEIVKNSKDVIISKINKLLEVVPMEIRQEIIQILFQTTTEYKIAS
jgi:hypothetical protein